MSYSIYVHCSSCGEILNNAHTSLPFGMKGLLEELGAPVHTWNGRSGVSVLPNLQSAISRLDSYDELVELREKWEVPNPPWSKVDRARAILAALRDSICREPYAKISVGD